MYTIRGTLNDRGFIEWDDIRNLDKGYDYISGPIIYVQDYVKVTNKARRWELAVNEKGLNGIHYPQIKFTEERENRILEMFDRLQAETVCIFRSNVQKNLFCYLCGCLAWTDNGKMASAMMRRYDIMFGAGREDFYV